MGVLAYTGTSAAINAQIMNDEVAAHTAQITLNKMKLTETLGSLPNVTADDLIGGFWFSSRDQSGHENVYRVDPGALATADLTPAQLTELRGVVASSTIINRGEMTDVASSELPSELQFHNALYGSSVGGTTTNQLRATLERRVKDNPTTQDLFELSYLYELMGEYAKRDALNAQNCRLFKQRCDTGIATKLTGRVVDDAGAGIQGATISIVSMPGVAAVRTDVHGAYTLSLKTAPMSKLRVRAHKRNYSDGYTDAVVLSVGSRDQYTLADITLESPVTIVTIDLARHTVTGAANRFNSDGSIELRTERSVYQIPPRAIVRRDGSIYAGDTVDVYLYEFTKGTPPTALMSLDTFDQVMGYAGNLMKSFGMPYIQFFSSGGEELHVRSSNPMILTYQIADMDALRQNTDRIYRALTDADMQVLVSASSAGGYPIDRAWLIDHHMLQFPAFWVFDRVRGVWDNIGINVVNPQGLIRTAFYTMRDSVQ